MNKVFMTRGDVMMSKKLYITQDLKKYMNSYEVFKQKVQQKEEELGRALTEDERTNVYLETETEINRVEKEFLDQIEELALNRTVVKLHLTHKKDFFVEQKEVIKGRFISNKWVKPGSENTKNRVNFQSTRQTKSFNVYRTSDIDFIEIID